MRYLGIILLFLFLSIELGFANAAWEEIGGIKEAVLLEVDASLARDRGIYVSSKKSLYRSQDNGETWQGVFYAKGKAGTINFFKPTPNSIFVCTENGLFKGHDVEARWERVFKGIGEEENNVNHIAFWSNGDIYIGTEGGLFISADNGNTWNKDPGVLGDKNIKWIAFLNKDKFVVTTKGLYKGSNGGWKKVFSVSEEELDEEETESNDGDFDESLTLSKSINSIFVTKKALYLAADSGVFISRDKGENWKRGLGEGLLSSKIKRLLWKDALFYAVTDKGVHVFSTKNKRWISLYSGMATTQTNSISSDDNGNIWVATENGLYKSKLKDIVLALSFEEEILLEDKKKEVLKMFKHEPTISEVQRKAIEYAEVHPDKILTWRRGAARRAFLPKLSFGYDDSVSDWYNGQGGGTANPERDRIIMADDRTIGWDVSLTWDFGDLVWNSYQTTIDVRSKLMVQLRDDLLDEVTRTYFERRRLQIEMHLSPPKELKKNLEKELRIEELTADIDALTGGYFSREVALRSNR